MSMDNSHEQMQRLMEYDCLFEPSAIYGQWRHIFREGAFNPIEKLLLRRKYYILRRKATQVAIIQTILKNSEPKQSEQVATDK